MSSFLIDKNSPIRRTIGGGVGGHPLREPSTRLRHRSRQSESEHDSLQRQDSFQENRKLEFENSHDPPACTDLKDDVNQEMHGHGVFQTSTSMIGYFMSELTKGYKLEDDAREFVERRDRVYTSVYTPKNFEKFCAFGFLQCLDSILYIVTFLPLRILVALVQVITYPFSVIFRKDARILDSAQICDLLKGVILVISCYLTSYMDMSMIYHIVRGQSIIKFYVFYNMLDVMDKLISGFGQDVLDSLYWTAVEPRGRKREHFGTIFHLIFAIVYVVLHTMMILIQAIILNVAFNSHNKNLLTIMLSNNFVELKGNLFKRLDKNNLCQITYSDVKERFHYLVLLLFVLIRNMKELEWSWALAFPLVQDAVIVFGVEIVVDWVKHAFINKFNELSASLYDDFALGLAQDIASSRKKHAFTDFSDQVCRRMGFTPIPLICLLFMVCSKSFTINGTLPWFLVFMFYLCLVSTKVFNSIILLGWAQHLTAAVRSKSTKPSGTVVNSQVIPKKEDKMSSSKSPSPPPPPPPPEPEIQSDITTVDGTSIKEECEAPVPSPFAPCPFMQNGDNLFDLPSTLSQDTSTSSSPSHSKHQQVALTPSFEEIVASGDKELKDDAERSSISHENVPLLDSDSSENCLNMDNLVEEKLNELSSPLFDEKLHKDKSDLIDRLECSESQFVQKDSEDALHTDGAEPFMFKLSTSMTNQHRGFVHSTPKEKKFSSSSSEEINDRLAVLPKLNIQEIGHNKFGDTEALLPYETPIEKVDPQRCDEVEKEVQANLNCDNGGKDDIRQGE